MINQDDLQADILRITNTIEEYKSTALELQEELFDTEETITILAAQLKELKEMSLESSEKPSEAL